MPSVRNPRHVLYAVILVTALVVTALLVKSFVAEPAPPTYESQGVIFAEAYSEPENIPFLRVNGHVIGYAEYAEQKARFITALATHKTQLETAVPIEQWVEPQGDALNNPARPLPEFMFSDKFRAMVGVMEKHGADAGAMGALIMDYARYSAAVNKGFDVSRDDLTAEVAMMREIYEANVRVSQQGEFGEFKGYISVVGEDVFWGDIYPAKLRLTLAVGDWRLAALAEVTEDGRIDDKDRTRIFAALDQQALDGLQIDGADQRILTVTPEQGLAYIREYNDVMFSTE